MIINFSIKVGDTVYVVNDRYKDEYSDGNDSPYVVYEEIVAYLALGKDDELFVFTEECGVAQTINKDWESVFVNRKDCEAVCEEANEHYWNRVNEMYKDLLEQN